MTWPTVKLGDVCVTTSGGTPKRGLDKYYGGGIAWVKSGELHCDLVTITEETLTNEGLNNSSAKLMPKGTVLLAMYGATIGAVSVLDIEAATNQAICCIRANPKKLYSKFLVHFLKASKDRLINYAVGGAQPNINQDIIRNLQIKLPPLAEQQRIAAILDKAEEIKRKREQAIEKLDELAQSTFVEMFGEAKWRKVAIAEVTEQVQNCSPQSKFVGEFTYVDIGAVDNVSKKVINPQLLNKDDAPSRARQLIEKDDVLVSTVRPNLNAVAQVESEYFNAVASTGFCVLRCKQELVLPEYIFAIVKSTKFVNEMVSLATGASYPAINDKIISQYLISLPPIELQRAFSEKIKALREYASKSVKHDDKLIGLTASLQHQAFTTGFCA